ncbi:MAG: clostripain-related cysteine peptidase [Coriobacteriales bacterium]|nr:clostripain-related cysteine peptidase [Coriobacteriales bacterium]
MNKGREQGTGLAFRRGFLFMLLMLTAIALGACSAKTTDETSGKTVDEVVEKSAAEVQDDLPRITISDDISGWGSETRDAPNTTDGPSTQGEGGTAQNPIVAAQSAGLPREPKEYTVMVYLVGSDLEANSGRASRDLQEMLSSGVDASRVNVVVFTGGSQYWHANIPNDRNCVIDITSGKGNVVAATNDLLNMGQASTLSSFVSWATSNYPARHSALVLWDHGKGPSGGACFDQLHDYDSLSLDEMSQAMRDAGFGADRKLDWVGFDACLMASLESMQTWQDYARYFVGSQEVEDAHGWSYAFLNVLNRTSDASQVVRAIVDEFGSYSSLQGGVGRSAYTLSAVDLSRVGEVERALEALSETLLLDLASQDLASLASAREQCRSFGTALETVGGAGLVDLVDLANRLVGEHPLVAQALVSAANRAVVANVTNVSDAHGISLCFPHESGREDLPVVEGSYGRMLDAYGTRGEYARVVDWTLGEFRKEADTASLALSTEQAQGLALARYSILRDLGDGSYVPVVTNVHVDVDNDGVVRVPLNPALIVSRADHLALPVRQLRADSSRQEYVCPMAYLLPAPELVDGLLGASPISLSVVVDSQTGEVSSTWASYVNAELGLSGHDAVDLGEYRELMHYFWRPLTPKRDDAGSLLPHAQWESKKGKTISSTSTLSGDVSFATRHTRDLSKGYVLQVVLTDLAGNQHGSELLALDGIERKETSCEVPGGSLTFALYGDHAEWTGCVGELETIVVPEQVEGLPVTAVADGTLEWETHALSLTLPSSVKTIGSGALNLIRATHIDLGEGVEEIGDRSLCYADVQELRLPSRLRRIGDASLRRLGVAMLRIPASVEHVGEAALTGCEDLVAYDVDASCKAVRVTDGVLFSADGATLMAFPAGRTGAYQVPAGTKKIGYGAFSSTVLESVVFPEGLVEIDNCAFYWTVFEIPQPLASIRLPKSLQRLGSYAFGCDTHGSSLAKAPLMETLRLGSELRSVGTGAFSGINVARIEVDDANPAFSSPGGFLANKAGDTILQAPEGMGHTVVVPQGITAIRSGAFCNYEEGTEFVLPSSLTYISEDAFNAHFAQDGRQVWDISIHCEAGSVAEEFARVHGIPCDNQYDPQ